MKLQSFGIALTASLALAPACHTSDPCQAAIPAGSHFQLDVLEDVSSPQMGAECSRIDVQPGDMLKLTTGEPVDSDPESNCSSTAAAGPPDFHTTLTVKNCQPMAGIGTRCSVVDDSCADSLPGLSTYLTGGDDSFIVGQQREMHLKISYGHSLSTCPMFSCNYDFRVRVTRID